VGGKPSEIDKVIDLGMNIKLNEIDKYLNKKKPTET
jgi:hypothetical protein